MKRFTHQNLFLLAFLLLFCFNAKSQELNLFELQNFCSQTPESANSKLLTKGWEFISAKSVDENSTLVRWEFVPTKTQNGGNLVELSTFDKEPNSVRYQFNQKEYYLAITNQFSANSYKLMQDSIANQVVSATYGSANFILVLNYKRVSNDEKDFTSYEIIITQKSKSLIHTVIAENPSERASAKKKEYDLNENLVSEYFLKDGKPEGLITYFFPDGTIRKEALMKAGIENGPATLFNYDPVTKKLLTKTTGKIVNDKEEGIWLKNKITDNAVVPIEMTTYEEGLKQGEFKSIRNDSLILMNYKKDLLEGHYRVFIHNKPDLKITEVDTTLMTRVAHGFYVENKKIGLWKNFDTTGSLTEEGYLLNDAKTGVWKYYYPSTAADANIPSNYSGILYLEETYKGTKRNGESIRYSFLKKEEIPCVNANEKKCYRYVFENNTERATLLNDILDGSYELTDSNNKIISKGLYSNGKQNGKWMLLNESRIVKRPNKTIETGFFEEGTKQGKWERTDEKNVLLETYSYKNDLLNDDYYLYQNNIPVEKWHFDNNQFNELSLLDSEKNPITTYVLKDFKDDTYTCEKSERNAEGICIKTFKVKNTIPKEENIYTYKSDFESMPENICFLNGAYVLKNVENNVVEEGIYDQNQKVGKWTNFYYDQNVRTSLTYENGAVIAEDYFDLKKNEPYSGEFIFKDKNSEISEERKVKDGVRHGTTRFKDLKDKTIKKESYKKGILKE